MTDQEINIAIAEAVGARFFSEDGGAFWHFVTKDGREFGPPTEDLNAMHEAEKLFYAKSETLEGAELMRDYSRLLCDLAKYPLHATARQRAEAFLRTLGKWKE